MKVNIAVTSPTDSTAPDSVYVEVRNEYGDRTWKRAGASNHSSKTNLSARGAQFHEIEVPAWVSPIDQAVTLLKRVSSDLYWDRTEQSRKVDEAIALVRAGK